MFRRVDDENANAADSAPPPPLPSPTALELADSGAAAFGQLSLQRRNQVGGGRAGTRAGRVTRPPQRELYATFVLLVGLCLLCDVGVLLCGAFFVALAALFVPVCVGAHLVNAATLRANRKHVTWFIVVGARQALVCVFFCMCVCVPSRRGSVCALDSAWRAGVARHRAGGRLRAGRHVWPERLRSRQRNHRRSGVARRHLRSMTSAPRYSRFVGCARPRVSFHFRLDRARHHVDVLGVRRHGAELQRGAEMKTGKRPRRFACLLRVGRLGLFEVETLVELLRGQKAKEGAFE